MKKAKHSLILISATCLAVLGFYGQAENLSKQVVQDLKAQGSDSILLSIYCIAGPGSQR